MSKDIIEENKLIAEFMGWTKVGNRFEMSWTEGEWLRNKSIKETEFNYHNNWSLLMPVVEKIEAIENSDLYEVDIFGKCCDIGGKIETASNSKIEATWRAIIQFIQWYNSQPVNK